MSNELGQRPGSETAVEDAPAPKLRERLQESRQRSLESRVQRVNEHRRNNRYLVVHDLTGPKVRLGALWLIGLLLSIALSTVVLGLLLGVVAGLAAHQSALAWTQHGERPQPVVAAVAAGGVPIAATISTEIAGFWVLLIPVMALVPALVSRSSATDEIDLRDTDPDIDLRDDAPLFDDLAASSQPEQADAHTAASGADQLPMRRVAYTLQTSLFTGFAAATPVLADRVEIGAAVVLLLMVWVYDAGDFLIGSAATHPAEGPLAGILGVVVVAFAAWVLDPPPFEGAGVWVFAAVVAIFAPVGQIAASFILPRADSPARALRRLDSLLVAGPLWMLVLWSYV
jgi:hypothetical protein